MSAKTNDPAEHVQHESLAAALAAFQAALPAVHKSARGQVPGKRDHRYADLADLSGTVLPLLGRHGLSWITMPTFEDGRFVLRYELLHESGESRVGFYPLPSDSDAWKMGSALTYGRRYLLSAVTGVAADEDDDGAAAAGVPHDGGRQQSRPAAQNGHQGNGETRRPAQPAVAEPDDEMTGGANPAALAVVQAACDEHGWDRHKVADRYTAHFSEDIAQIKSVPRAKAFVKLLDRGPEVGGAVPAMNGAGQ